MDFIDCSNANGSHVVPWSLYETDYLQFRLSTLTRQQLWGAHKLNNTNGFRERQNKDLLVRGLLVEIRNACTALELSETSDFGLLLQNILPELSLVSFNDCTGLQLMHCFMFLRFGSEVYDRLAKPPLPPFVSTCGVGLPVTMPEFQFENLTKSLTITEAKKILQSHLRTSDNEFCRMSSKFDLKLLLYEKADELIVLLKSLCIHQLVFLLSCYDPDLDLTQINVFNAVSFIVHYEFGDVVRFAHQTMANPIQRLKTTWKSLIENHVVDTVAHSSHLTAKKTKRNRNVTIKNYDLDHSLDEPVDSTWPQCVAKELIVERLSQYHQNMKWKDNGTCAICGRRQYNTNLTVILSSSPQWSLLHTRHLIISDESFIREYILRNVTAEFLYDDKCIDSMMLDRHGLCHLSTDNTEISVCHECLASLTHGNMPTFSLNNHLFRGELPLDLKDLTWVEEMICSQYRNNAYVIRLYNSSDEKQPFVFYGNCCAHEMNINSTCSILPRTPADVNSMISIVFIGSKAIKSASFKNILHVRKYKVLAFLRFLKHFNLWYKDIEINLDNLNLYPEDGTLPNIESRVIESGIKDGLSTLQSDTAGIYPHPGESAMQLDSSPEHIMIDTSGVYDSEGSRIPARVLTASALQNLVPHRKDIPDLIVSNGRLAVNEYNNPKFFPLQYPTLFPYGYGCFDDKSRKIPLSLQRQANYYFDIRDPCFRYHRAFKFVLLNLWQRRMCHLFSYFTSEKNQFETTAPEIVGIGSKTMYSAADKILNERYSDLTNEEKKVFKLLKTINTVAVHVPGSHASKNKAKNEIMSYVGAKGVPHLFLTINPCADHSPLFQVMYGDAAVSLDERYPDLVSSHERSVRLALDPVAAADFFQFCIIRVFEDLFAWDFRRGVSEAHGGILGRLAAFYGTDEFTDRGGLHAHFELWLEGGLNPHDIHQKLSHNPVYQEQFFKFFESIINTDCPTIFSSRADDPDTNPRTELPPCPPNLNKAKEISEEEYNAILNDWDDVFMSEVSYCAEKLQRHTCRKVCHKYGHEFDCRFKFPKAQNAKAFYDEEEQAIVFAYIDGTINSYNPHMLVFTRHNHDLKCILSGKAAKAAMYYITDYITKMDLSTCELITKCGKAALECEEDNSESSSDKVSALKLLRKCITHFQKCQQIHAQQAVRLIRGLGDTITSHKTVPMLSGALLMHVQNTAKKEISIQPEEEDNEQTTEKQYLKIEIDKSGALVRRNQIHDYIFRDNALRNINFYDFVRCFKIQKNSDTDATSTSPSFPFNDKHVLHSSHHLVQFRNVSFHSDEKEFIPRPIGHCIPKRRELDLHACFMLAHFKPFSDIDPLLPHGISDYKQAFNEYNFDNFSFKIINNWDQMNECEDARDAERLKKQSSEDKASKETYEQLKHLMDANDDEFTHISDEQQTTSVTSDFNCTQKCLNLQESGYFSTAKIPDDKKKQLNCISNINCSPEALKKWKEQLAEQEKEIMDQRKNIQPLNKDCGDYRESVRNTIDNFEYIKRRNEISVPPTSQIPSHVELSTKALLEKIQSIADNAKLNEKQFYAFTIIVKQFLKMTEARLLSENKLSDLKINTQEDYSNICLFMTGPGGTGKTHVINSVRLVLDVFNASNRIRFLAPTGTAASLIDGSTIHKGLGISIGDNKGSLGMGKGNRKPGFSQYNYSLSITVSTQQTLRNEWKDVDIIFIDEVSLLSLQLLADIDYALRYAKDTPEKNFGGAFVILSGDLCQFPPVKGTPCYRLLAAEDYKKTAFEAKARLGRLAWRSITDVIEFTEQHRMKDDKQYAEAVQHLRVRKCTEEDVSLFNSRLIKSDEHPNGIDMSKEPYINSSAIVKTNNERHAINYNKVLAEAKRQSVKLVLCTAHDRYRQKTIPNHEKFKSRTQLLAMDISSHINDGALPGIVPLYVGMPVVLRGRNISTELKITNGAEGVVHHIETYETEEGFKCAKLILVKIRGCKAHLDNLPAEVVPILPATPWTFSTLVELEPGIRSRILVTRHQLNVQGRFCMTGHIAQGRTIDPVMCNLHEGKFAAYVMASRASNRYSLTITQPVSTDILNKELPKGLLHELKYLQVMEHNTLIRYGFKNGVQLDLPSENEDSQQRQIVSSAVNMTVIEDKPSVKRKRTTKNPTTTRTNTQKKRKAVDNTNYETGNHNEESSSSELAALPAQPQPQLDYPGCSWSTDWSCAYDTMFMSLYFASKFYNITSNAMDYPHTHLTEVTIQLIRDLLLPAATVRDFNRSRDTMRDMLFQINSEQFPRFGPNPVSFAELCHYLKSQLNLPYDLVVTSAEQSIQTHFPDFISAASLVDSVEHIPVTMSMQQCMDQFFYRQIFHSLPSNNNVLVQYTLLDPPRWLMFDIDPMLTQNITPCFTLRFQSQSSCVLYQIVSIVYFGSVHFTCRLINSNERQIWTYDGQKNGGHYVLERQLPIDELLVNNCATMDGKHMHVLLYVKT